MKRYLKLMAVTTICLLGAAGPMSAAEKKIDQILEDAKKLGREALKKAIKDNLVTIEKEFPEIMYLFVAKNEKGEWVEIYHNDKRVFESHLDILPSEDAINFITDLILLTNLQEDERNKLVASLFLKDPAQGIKAIVEPGFSSRKYHIIVIDAAQLKKEYWLRPTSAILSEEEKLIEDKLRDNAEKKLNQILGDAKKRGREDLKKAIKDNLATIEKEFSKIMYLFVAKNEEGKWSEIYLNDKQVFESRLDILPKEDVISFITDLMLLADSQEDEKNKLYASLFLKDSAQGIKAIVKANSGAWHEYHIIVIDAAQLKEGYWLRPNSTILSSEEEKLIADKLSDKALYNLTITLRNMA